MVISRGFDRNRFWERDGESTFIGCNGAMWFKRRCGRGEDFFELLLREATLWGSHFQECKETFVEAQTEVCGQKLESIGHSDSNWSQFSRFLFGTISNSRARRLKKSDPLVARWRDVQCLGPFACGEEGGPRGHTLPLNSFLDGPDRRVPPFLLSSSTSNSDLDSKALISGLLWVTPIPFPWTFHPLPPTSAPGLGSGQANSQIRPLCPQLPGPRLLRNKIRPWKGPTWRFNSFLCRLPRKIRLHSTPQVNVRPTPRPRTHLPSNC